MYLPEKVILKEVGPRDGLQNEQQFIPTKDKIQWIDKITDAGVNYVEISSFVHPKWVPQLEDAADVAKGIKRKEGVTYAALVPNAKGLERALKADVNEVSVFMSATETHNQKNINKSIEETFPVLAEVIEGAAQIKVKTRGYISTVFGCPFEGKVDVENVIKIADHLFEAGIEELSLGDTIGVANPLQVEKVLETLLQRFPADKLALHFHDTRGTALANVLASLQAGITTFDGSVGGLGGCPYAPGATGNVATEDLLYMLKEMNIETGIDMDKLLGCSQWIEQKMRKQLPSKMLQVHKANAR